MTNIQGPLKLKEYKDSNNFFAAEIMSTPYLKDSKYPLTGKGTFHMILTHIVQKDKEYEKYYREEKGLKLLDNSLFELGVALPVEEVLRAAEQVRADILVSPDVIRDGPQTVANAKAFVERLRELGKLDQYSIMAVPQGSEIGEWIECYNQLSAIEEIECIGLSIIGMVTAMQENTGTTDIVINRTKFIEYMSKMGIWNKSKWHHLLGLGRGPFEMLLYTHLDFIKSNDSSNAWWHGYDGIRYKRNGELREKLTTEVNFSAPVRSKVESDVQYNLEVQREITQFINGMRNINDTKSK